MPPTRTTPPSEAGLTRLALLSPPPHLPRTTSETHGVTLANPCGDASLTGLPHDPHPPRATHPRQVRYSLGRILDCARQRSPLSGGQGEQR